MFFQQSALLLFVLIFNYSASTTSTFAAFLFTTILITTTVPIRSAIETGWDRSDYEYTEKLFLNCVDFYRSKPTNGEFISIIVDKLLLQDGKINY